jgi:hypothetical protein
VTAGPNRDLEAASPADADRLVRLDLYLRATTPSIATRGCPLVPTTTSSMVCAAADVQLNE